MKEKKVSKKLATELVKRLIERGEIFAAELVCIDYDLKREGFKWPEEKK